MPSSHSAQIVHNVDSGGDRGAMDLATIHVHNCDCLSLGVVTCICLVVECIAVFAIRSTPHGFECSEIRLIPPDPGDPAIRGRWSG